MDSDGEQRLHLCTGRIDGRHMYCQFANFDMSCTILVLIEDENVVAWMLYNVLYTHALKLLYSEKFSESLTGIETITF